MHRPGRQLTQRTALGIASLIIVMSLASSTTSAAADRFQYDRRSTLPPLLNSRVWVLQGAKLEGGGCRYLYPSAEVELPAGGWELRSISIDTSSCRKLMEEGTPTASPRASAPESTTKLPTTRLPVSGASSDPTASLAASTTRSAWQIAVWSDFLGYPVNYDGTEITWTYNGSIVLSGNAAGYWYRIGGWEILANDVTQGFFSGAFRGQTTATFRNQGFCWPDTVYTYYYYNRMWGHYNGTATRSQSSDSVNECVALHITVSSAYGSWPY